MPNHMQIRKPNITRAGDIPVDPDGIFKKLRRNLDSPSVKVPSLTFFNVDFTVRTTISANPVNLVVTVLFLFE